MKGVVEFNLNDVIRGNRNWLLRASDWTQLPDSALSDEKKAEWATYRQTLRDIPANASGAELVEGDTIINLDWPTKPE